jgi:hypothetical protein
MLKNNWRHRRTRKTWKIGRGKGCGDVEKGRGDIGKWGLSDVYVINGQFCKNHNFRLNEYLFAKNIIKKYYL